MEKNLEVNENPSMSEDQKKELLKALLDDVLKTAPEGDVTTKIEQLKKAQNTYATCYEFKIGDIVRWKELMKNKSMPEYNEPAIVLDILTEPIFNSRENIGSTYFNEQLNLKLGIITDNTFLTFYHEGNRFELYTE